MGAGGPSADYRELQSLHPCLLQGYIVFSFCLFRWRAKYCVSYLVGLEGHCPAWRCLVTQAFSPTPFRPHSGPYATSSPTLICLLKSQQGSKRSSSSMNPPQVAPSGPSIRRISAHNVHFSSPSARRLSALELPSPPHAMSLGTPCWRTVS